MAGQSFTIQPGSPVPVSLGEAGSTVYVSGADVSYGSGTITAPGLATLAGTYTFSVSGQQTATVNIVAAPAVPAGSGSPSGPAVGTTIGQTTVDGSGNPVITFLSGWGIDSSGNAYYDTAGASTGEDAVLTLEPDGSLNVVQPIGVTP